MRKIVALLLTIATTSPAAAQTMTTAAEIRPILTATKPAWVAVNEYDGQDLVYFTNLLAWRCGLTSGTYGLNGAPADIPLPMEPCYEDEATPNALKDVPYIEAPLGSVTSISIAVTYDDGSTDTAEYERKAVLMP